MSGQRRCAGAKGDAWRRRRGEDNDESMVDTRLANRQRQVRRLRNESTGGEMDDGADGAIIVGVVVLRRCRLRSLLRPLPARGGKRKRGAAVTKCVEMNVAEGEGKLQRQRRQSEPGAEPLAAADPTHQVN